MSSLTTRPLKLPRMQHPRTKRPLYPHQAFMLDEWERHDTFLLITKTGTGKTVGAILPVLKNGERAICVYPTNELIRDQVRNIKNIAESEGLEVCLQTTETTSEEYASANLVLVQIDANILDSWRRKRHWRNKWRALRELLEADKPKIILTNPDILFLIFSLKYDAEALAALSGYRTLILDEFHLYSGVELTHALFMLHLSRCVGIFKKILLLSATPAKEVKDQIERILDNPIQVDETVTCSHEIVDEWQAVQSVKINPIQSGSDVIETAVTLVKDLHDQIIQLRQINLESDYVPAVIVVNSVINAIRLEDRLAEEGFLRDEMAIIRGLSAKEVRNTKGKLLAIGTSAIEVGIDFKCDYLIFEAFEAASFMQRFGRVGRHRPGTAYILCSQNVVKGIDSMIQELGQEIDRGDLEKRVYLWYPSLETRSWFATTPMGLISSFTMAESLIKRVHNDTNADAKLKEYIETDMENHYTTYCQKLGCLDRIKRVLFNIHSARNGKKFFRWISVYRDLDTFRTSLPSEWVLDFAELERRGGNWESAKYSVDVATLLRRAEGLRFNERIPNPDGEMGIITVKGYGRYKKIWTTPTFEDGPFGTPYCTDEIQDILFIQEGHKTSLSHVMTLKKHIFMIFPKSISYELDWRLPVFECGKNLIAFDGTALMLCEIYNNRIEQKLSSS